jgi:hypothetical protein
LTGLRVFKVTQEQTVFKDDKATRVPMGIKAIKVGRVLPENRERRDTKVGKDLAERTEFKEIRASRDRGLKEIKDPKESEQTEFKEIRENKAGKA